MSKNAFAFFVVVVLLSGTVFAVNPGTEIMVPAAGRGPGAGGSLWVTALYIHNPNPTELQVSFSWLLRDHVNTNPQTVTRMIDGDSSLVLDDAIMDLFNMSSAGGAILIRASAPVAVSSGIFNRAGGDEYGQGFEGVPTDLAIASGHSSQVAGITSNPDYRTNFFVAAASQQGCDVLVQVFNQDKQVIGSQTYSLGAWEPTLKDVADLVSVDVSGATVSFSVTSGSAFVGCSRINEASGDPLTLNSWWECGSGASASGLAPVSLAGLELEMTVTPIECGAEPFTEDVGVSAPDDTHALISVNGSNPMSIPIASYTAAGDIGYVETSVPDWQITETWLNMIWTSASGGRYVGAATDYDGSPIKFSGTFSLVSP